MNIELFHFLRPYWLLAIIPFLIALVAALHRHDRHSNWRRVVAPELLPLLLQGNRQARKIGVLVAISIAGILSIVALAGPTWERIPQPVFRDDDALVIVLDLSRSMDAQDIKPSRLQRARYKITDILKSRLEGQAALIVYAADAFTVIPLTDDDDTIISQLPALTTDLVPVQGSRTDRALDLASQLLRQASQTRGRILLITDEVESEIGLDAAGRLIADGYQLFILGVGTADGALIPAAGGSLKDSQGNIVMAQLDVDNLRRIAHEGGGRYASVTGNDEDIRRLALDRSLQINDIFEEDDDLTSDIWKEAGPWLLLPVLPLVASAFRRGILVVSIIFLLPIAPPAGALGTADFWRNLWQTPDQQGQILLDSGQITEAADRFEHPLWKGSAHYSAGNYQRALKHFQSVEGARARYNEGNALVRLGRYEEAIKSYERAIRQSPGHKDAAHNKRLALKLLEERKQQPTPEQQQGEPQSEENAQQQQGTSGEQANSQHPTEQGERDPLAQEQGDETQQSSGQNASEDPQSQQQESAEQQDGQQMPSPEQASRDDDSFEHFDSLAKEQELARELWLKRIPQDSTGLLKRKFQYQYRQRARTDGGNKPW